MEGKIRELEEKIENITVEDKDALTEIRENFYLIQNEAFRIRWKSIKLENEICTKREHINNSLF